MTSIDTSAVSGAASPAPPAVWPVATATLLPDGDAEIAVSGQHHLFRAVGGVPPADRVLAYLSGVAAMLGRPLHTTTQHHGGPGPSQRLAIAPDGHVTAPDGGDPGESWLVHTTGAAETVEATTPTVDEDADEPPSLSGPRAPQTGVPAPPVLVRLPRQAVPAGVGLWWLGVHGGAGESTLASLAPGWAAAGHGWPCPPDGAPVRVVLCARTHQRGLRAAQAAATTWASGQVPHVQLLGLVLVADAPGKLPRPLREGAQVISGGLPRVWQLPWIESWRTTKPAPDPAGTSAAGDVPRAVRRLVTQLHALLDPGATGTTTTRRDIIL